ncbi:MAG: hypothetical protein QOJ76_2527 [Acidobacteriota bacterium]|nr:hypothetical protein [Acidobacteriota bacterium]
MLVHATVACFVFRSVCRRWLTPGRHGSTFVNLSRPKTWCLLVFVLVALPPPPVYVLDNEAQPKLSDVRYPDGQLLLRSADAFLSARPGRCPSAFSLRKPFGFGRGVSGSNFDRRLLSSSIASPRRLPIPTPVTTPLRIATGAGLYARAHTLSTLFLEKVFPQLLPDFPAFCPMRQLHPRPFSTGGKFITLLWKTLHIVLFRRARTQ